MTDLEARQLQAEHQKTVAATSECEESLLRLRDREKRVRKRLAGARAPTAATGKAIASARSLEETSLESQAELQRACNGDARQDEKPDIDTDDLDDQGFREWPNAYHFPPGPLRRCLAVGATSETRTSSATSASQLNIYRPRRSGRGHGAPYHVSAADSVPWEQRELGIITR